MGNGNEHAEFDLLILRRKVDERLFPERSLETVGREICSDDIGRESRDVELLLLLRLGLGGSLSSARLGGSFNRSLSGGLDGLGFFLLTRAFCFGLVGNGRACSCVGGALGRFGAKTESVSIEFGSEVA